MNAILSSLAAFVSAGVRPRTPLAKAIVAMLVVKLLAIAGIGLVMGRDRPAVDASAVARQIGISLPPLEEGRR